MAKTEFSPPIPITEYCGFCGTQIPEEQIMTTGITCVDCKRPVCPSCKGDINKVGLTGCPYCETVRLDESNDAVKKALQDIYNQKLTERKQKIEKQVSGQDEETPWMMTSYGTGTPMQVSTSWSASSSSIPVIPPGTPITMDDQYPYRGVVPYVKDPIVEPMDRPKKLPKKLPKPTGYDQLMKPKITINSQVGKGGFVSGGWGEQGNMNHVITEEREVSAMEASALGKSETTFPIISRKVRYDAASTKAFVTEKRWATDEEVEKATEAMAKHEDKEITKALGLEDKLYPHQKQWLDDMVEAKKTPEDVKEEAYRGTGRTTVHCKAALNHIQYATRKGIAANVLYITEHHRIAKHCQRTFAELVRKEGLSATGSQGMVYFTGDRRILFASIQSARTQTMGRYFTLVIADMSEQSLKKYQEDINSIMGHYMVNHEQPIYVAKTVSGKQRVKKIMRKMEHFEGKEVKTREVLPSEDWSASWFPLSRKEKPPVSALVNLRGPRGPSLWSRIKGWLKFW